MNTINGNFIERVIPNIKNATLNLLIGDQLATMNLADFQAAIAPSSKGLKMKDNLPLDGTLNNVVDSSDVVTISPLQLSTTQVAMLGATFFGASSASTNILTLQSTTRNQFKVPSGSTTEFWYSASAEGMRMDANGNLAIGTTALSARLHVRGDGTNPIARFERGAGGSLVYSITEDGYLNGLNGSKFGAYDSVSGAFTLYATNVSDSISRFEFWNGTTPSLRMTLHNGAAFSSGINTRSILNLNYTINNTGGTNTINGFLLNATETSITGTTHNLMDLQVGGVSNFNVVRNGLNPTVNLRNNAGFILSLFSNYSANRPGISATSNLYFGAGAFSHIQLLAASATTELSSLLAFYGSSSSFPAIKRNGAAIDFRLADDSAACDITANIIRAAGKIDLYGDGSSGVIGMVTLTNTLNLRKFVKIVGEGGIGANDASAAFQIDGTNRGFLPPRMTTAQVNAIATPAEGLQVYNTTINHMCFYMSGAWTKVNHSPM